MEGRNYSSCGSEVAGGTRARPQPKYEHLFPNKSSDKNDIVQLPSHVWNGGTSDSLCTGAIFPLYASLQVMGSLPSCSSLGN